MTKIEYIIDIIDLKAHPEGGYFKKIYRNFSVIKTN